MIRERIERNWPAVLIACVCSGISAANVVRIPVLVACLLAAGAGALALRLAGADRFACVAAGLVLLGLAWGGARLGGLAASELDDRLGTPAPARLVVTSAPRKSRFSARVFATVVRFDGARVRERVLLSLPPERAPPRGAVLETRRAWPIEPRGPETGFDERRWLARRGVHVVLRATDVTIVGRRGGIGGVTDRLRMHVEHTLGLAGGGERRSLLAGVVLGADEDVDEELRAAFRSSGLLHLMAVSGQNVAIIAAGVVGLAILVGLSSLWGRVAAIAVVLGYAGAVGWQPSVVRATVAGCLVSLAWLTSRPRDRWYAMALGALVLLVWMPASVLEAGFQLSFVAVAAIFVLVPRIETFLDGYPVPRLLAQGGALAGGCAVATAPVLLLHFDAVPVWTVPANILAESAMAPLLALALVASAVEPVSAAAAAALVWLAGWCAWWLAWCARVFAGLPLATVNRWPAIVALASAGLFAVAWRRVPRYRRARLSLAAVTACAIALIGLAVARRDPPWEPPRGLRVTFLDVGQGDSALLEVPEGAILVDQGPPEADVAGQLRRMGLRSLAALVLTHPQRDHIGGAADVVRRLRVSLVLDPALAAPSADRDAVVAAARARSVRVATVRAGDRFRIGRLTLRILWPRDAGLPSQDPNERAVVALASYGDVDVLLPADAESEITARLPLRQVEVLKVAHHGSEDRGLAAQLRVLRPRVAVISVGSGNDYGHPRAETITALTDVNGLRLLRTDVDGRVVVESDGRSLSLRSS